MAKDYSKIIVRQWGCKSATKILDQPVNKDWYPGASWQAKACHVYLFEVTGCSVADRIWVYTYNNGENYHSIAATPNITDAESAVKAIWAR